MAGENKKGGKKLRRGMRTGRLNAQRARTTRNVAKRQLKFERRIKAEIEEAGDSKIPVYHRGYDGSHRGDLSHHESKADRLRAHLKWSVGMRRRSVG
jgi:hypothetical protein